MEEMTVTTHIQGKSKAQKIPKTLNFHVRVILGRKGRWGESERDKDKKQQSL